MSRAARAERPPAPAAVRWTAYVAVAIVFAIACAFLSNWQFSRNAERSEQLALVEANYDAPPVTLSNLIAPGETLSPGDEWRPVMLEGEYLTDGQLLARNRPRGGTAAFEVLVPFRLDDGRVLLVDRGWVPPGEHQPDPDVIPAAPSGKVTVIVRMRPGEALPTSGRTAPAGQVPMINLPLIADTLPAEIGGDLDTSAYGLMVSEDPAPASRPAQLSSPSDDPGPYLSYAIQWILFAVMGFIFIGYIIRTELRHRREDAEDEAVGQSAPDEPTLTLPPALQRSRRGSRPKDQDMSDEDAILDRVGR